MGSACRKNTKQLQVIHRFVPNDFQSIMAYKVSTGLSFLCFWVTRQPFHSPVRLLPEHFQPLVGMASRQPKYYQIRSGARYTSLSPTRTNHPTFSGPIDLNNSISGPCPPSCGMAAPSQLCVFFLYHFSIADGTKTIPLEIYVHSLYVCRLYFNMFFFCGICYIILILFVRLWALEV